MRRSLQRWLPLVLFLLIVMLGYAVCAKNAPHPPYRRTPKVCLPQQEPPPCEYICPDADTRAHADDRKE